MTKNNQYIGDFFCPSSEIHVYQKSGYWKRFAAALAAYKKVTNELEQTAKLIEQEIFMLMRKEPSLELEMLDIGPGYGTLSEKLSLSFERLVAVEPNPYLTKSLDPRYDNVIKQRWETAHKSLNERFSIVLALQLLYYFPQELQSVLLHSMVESLKDGGILFVTLDTFKGNFGKFILKWSREMNLMNHVVLPELVQVELSKRDDIIVREYELTATLETASMELFAESLSVYFDAHPAFFPVTNDEYRTDLKLFQNGDIYRAENKEILWVITKDG